MRARLILMLLVFGMSVTLIMAQPRPKAKPTPNKPKTPQQIQKETQDNIKKAQQELDSLLIEIEYAKDDRKRMLDSANNIRKQMLDSVDSLKIEAKRLREAEQLMLEDLRKNQNRDSVKKARDEAFNRVNKMPEKEFREKLNINVRNLDDWEAKALMLRRLNEMREEVNKLNGKYYDTIEKAYRCVVTTEIVDKNAKPHKDFEKLKPLKYDEVLDRCATIFAIAKSPYPWCYPEDPVERERKGLKSPCSYPEHYWVSIPFPFEMFDTAYKKRRSINKRMKDGVLNPRVCELAKALFVGKEDWICSENVYGGEPCTVEFALIGWNNSPGHAGCMYGEWTHVGFGFSRRRMVQNFGVDLEAHKKRFSHFSWKNRLEKGGIYNRRR